MMGTQEENYAAFNSKALLEVVGDVRAGWINSRPYNPSDDKIRQGHQNSNDGQNAD